MLLIGKGGFLTEPDKIKEEGHKWNEEEMQGFAITTNCRMDALLT